MMMNDKENMLMKLGIKPNGIKNASITQGDKGRLVVNLEFYNGDKKSWYYKGVPSPLAGPLPNTSFLNWTLCTKEEFESMGPIE